MDAVSGRCTGRCTNATAIARGVVLAGALALSFFLLGIGPALSADQTPLASAASCRNAGANCSREGQCCAGLVCQSGRCRAGCRIGGTFYAAGARNPANACQTCQPGVSLSAWTNADGATCSDGNACTSGDTCQTGVCTNGSPVVCTAQDQCRDAGTCNPATGACSNPSKANGTACNDGNACTQTDSCQSGTCIGSSLILCTAQDQCHSTGTCDPATGICSNPARANGTSCNDGSACTSGDACQAGVCTSTRSVICKAQDQCHDAGACDPLTGACTNPMKANGATCSDGSACTTVDTCREGFCEGASPVVCAAADPCHEDGVCNAATGLCAYAEKPDGTSCEDGNACTTADTCQSGACAAGASLTCVPQDQCHDAGTCDPSTGVCSNPPKPNGTSCSDENLCTVIDSCQGGVCTGTLSVPCAPNVNPCIALSGCNPFTGQCESLPKPNGSTCDDGNACTTSDSCQNGTCMGSTCPAGQACCGESGCIDIGYDSANCGTCGHMCENSLCLLGQCFDGCVIGGVGYLNGAHNPGNSCQVCDVALSRTSWTNLGTPTSTIVCHAGCSTGVCVFGVCNLVSPGGGCPSTTCAAGSCTDGTCTMTPINEGVSCTPGPSTNACRSGESGTCQGGTCVPANSNEGGYCRLAAPQTEFQCKSMWDGTCASGVCHPRLLPDETPCYTVFEPCRPGRCVQGICALRGGEYCGVQPYCGQAGTCNTETRQCIYSQTFPDGSIVCTTPGDDPVCCPGQRCGCPLGPDGAQAFCLFRNCWNQ